MKSKHAETDEHVKCTGRGSWVCENASLWATGGAPSRNHQLTPGRPVVGAQHLGHTVEPLHTMVLPLEHRWGRALASGGKLADASGIVDWGPDAGTGRCTVRASMAD